jgi:DNA polymerase I-like protein with 3'-5' exonuclease and polymerase domains
MPDLITDNKVYSQYNYYTMTGRPSNAFRGFNYAAMNKEDGTRSAFCSRFANGALVEMDFDSYHVRLIARLIGYNLPTSSIHDYLGQFYFGVSQLTDEQRNESKSITFRLLYGNIDSEFLSIPFFAKVNAFVYDLWAKWKTNGHVETPILRRPITKDMVKNMTANKLFNYYLQAVETEVSVQKIQQVQSILKDYETVMILYTYDSILIDLKLSEIEIIRELRYLLESGGFPVKIKYGVTYNNMQEIKK